MGFFARLRRTQNDNFQTCHAEPGEASQVDSDLPSLMLIGHFKLNESKVKNLMLYM